jgi:hypothetical protein
MTASAVAVVLSASIASAQSGHGQPPSLAGTAAMQPARTPTVLDRLKGAIQRLRPSAEASSSAARLADPAGPALPAFDPLLSTGNSPAPAERFSYRDPAEQAPGLASPETPLPVMLPQADTPRETAYASGPEKRITEILPYPDYEPDAEIRRDDPLRNQCPSPDNLCPPEVRLSESLWTPREITPSIFTWEASNLYHYPLYFEDPDLERYGHTYGCLVQPFDSVGRFGLQLVGLPYQMTIDPACRKIYTLGWYRPGECAPKLHYQIPWHHQAAINQALVTTGLFYLIP